MVVAAAGNSASGSDWCTRDYDSVTTPDKLVVGATTNLDEASSFSNYGACVHVQVFPSRSARMRPPASDHTPATARQRPPARLPALPYRDPPRMCTGPRLRHPGCVGWLKQHRHHHPQWHPHGGAACLGRRRPAACGGPDPLGGASQGDYSRRRRGGRSRTVCKSQSRGHAKPPPHRRRRNQAIPKPPEASAAAAYASALAAPATGASYGSYGSHWPWLCGGPIGWVVRAKHWVWWGGLLG